MKNMLLLLILLLGISLTACSNFINPLNSSDQTILGGGDSDNGGGDSDNG